MEGRYREWKGDIKGGREISRVEGRYRGWKGAIEGGRELLRVEGNYQGWKICKCDYQLTVTNGCRYCDSDSVAMVTKSMSRRGESTGGRERP